MKEQQSGKKRRSLTKKIIGNNSGFFDPFVFMLVGITAAIAIPQFVAYKAKAQAAQLEQVAQQCLYMQQLACAETGKFPAPAETPECGADRLPPDTEWTQQTGDGCKSLRVSARFLASSGNSFLYKVECIAEGVDVPVCTTNRIYE